MNRIITSFGLLKFLRTILDFLWAATLFGLVAGGVFLIVSFAIPETVSPSLFPPTLPVELNLSEVKDASGAQVVPLVESISGVAILEIPDSHSRLNSIGLLAQLIPLIVGFFILHQIFQAVKITLKKHPFSPEVVQRLRFAAYGMLAYGPVSWVSYFFAVQYIISQLGYGWNTIYAVGDVNILRNILIGLGVLVIATIFQVGVEMKQEKDLTV